jgi:8-oxo-dGTP diphosphatase
MSRPKEIYGVWGVLQEPQTKKVLLVANRRRRNKVDWSLPGGLVDEGESYPEALTREVEEESGLLVENWSQLLYRNQIKYRNRSNGRKDFNFNTEVYLGVEWSGSLEFNDPDGIVEHGLFAKRYLVDYLLRDRGLQICEPLNEWLDRPWRGNPKHFSYRVDGEGLDQKIRRVEIR